MLQTLAQSRAFHSGVTVFTPVLSILGLWWKKWDWERFVSAYFGFSISVISKKCFIRVFYSFNINAM